MARKSNWSTRAGLGNKGSTGVVSRRPGLENQPPTLALSATRLLLIFVLIAAVSRFLYVGQRSLSHHEISSLMFVRLDWHSFWRLVWQGDGNMIFYHLLLRFWLLLGYTQIVGRALSVLAGVATVPSMYVLGKRLFGRRTGLVAAFVLAVSPSHILASQWIRAYSLELLLIVLSILFFVRAVEEGGPRTWIVYALMASLAVYCHWYAVLIIVAQWLAILFLPRTRIPWKPLSATALLVAALLGPAIYYVVRHNVGHFDWIERPRLIELYHLANFLAAAGGKIPGDVVLAFSLAALVTSAVLLKRSASGSPEGWHYALLFTCLLFPPVAAFLFSYYKPIFIHRYLIIVLPAFLLLVAAGVAAWRASWPRDIAVVVALGFCTLCIARAYAPEEDWAGAMNYLIASMKPGDTVLFSGQGRTPLRYYRLQTFGYEYGGPEVNIPPGPYHDIALPQFSATHPRVWLVIFPNSAHVPGTEAIEDALGPHYAVHSLKLFRAITVRFYANMGSP